MSRIICGMFDKSLDADAALEEFKREGFQRSEVDAFYVSPPGQHAMTPVGGDAPSSSEGSRTAGVGAGLGAVIGAVIGAALGWLASAERSEEHTSELQSPCNLVCRRPLGKKKPHRRRTW